MLVLFGGVHKPTKLANVGTLNDDVVGPRMVAHVPQLCHSRYHVALPFKILGNKLPGGLKTPPTKTNNTTPHYCTKQEL